MANWAWPHTPASNSARLLLDGGPFHGEQVAFLPPDLPAPAQIAWTGWHHGGFTAHLYEWHGDTVMDRGRTDALIYRHTGRVLAAADIPPVLGDDVEVWADGAAMIARVFDVPAAMLWPGV